MRDKLILRPRTRHNMNLRINAGFRSGDKVLETKRLSVGYPGEGRCSPRLTCTDARRVAA